VLMVPMFVHFLDLNQKQAVATSLAVVILTSIAATISNARSPVPLIQWPVFFAAAGSSIIASYFMAERMKLMANETLTRIFSVVLISAGISMWFTASGKTKPAPAAGTGTEAAGTPPPTRPDSRGS
jgi:uncharacterized membrane protein YfcA